MSNYDFSTLNSTDFEKLICDLLNKKIEGNSFAKYRTSKEGKDRGIDILFSTKDNDFEIVVQVKHYVKSSFAKLKADLIKKESKKVKDLNPNGYIFATSLGLSVANKQEIMQIFYPYIRSLQDILGKDDINDLIALNKDIEEKHFKLWFSSTVGLQKLLDYRFTGRNNEFSENEVKRKLRLFVSTNELERARYILENNKFLIITGEPGVGKTTLSEILIYKYLSKDFKLTYIHDDIKDIELTLRDDDSKQIFYFDDFLGHTQAEINKSKAAEISLLKIISRIEKSTNKFLILNTRKFIITTFIEESERFKNFNPLRAENKIEIGAYSYGAKRRMLDNHIFECSLSEEHLQILRGLSFFICSHHNFTPRHIDFYTNLTHSANLNTDEFKLFIKDNLFNPKKIWEHAYCKQISIYENLFLNMLYSLGGSCSLELMELSYNTRLNYEVTNNNFVKPLNSFKNCLSNLNGGFIEINPNRIGKEISFINPSLEDFLRHWISENSLEVERILFSSVTINQWYYFFSPFVGAHYTINDKLSHFFVHNYNNLTKTHLGDEEVYKVVMLLFYFDEEANVELIGKILKGIKSWNFIYAGSETTVYSTKFLQRAKSNSQINTIISNLKLDFFLNTILSVTHIAELVDVITLFDTHYNFNFKNTFENREDDVKFKPKVKEIKELCKELMEELINLQYGYLLTNRQIDEHLEVIEQIKSLKSFIKRYLFPKFKINYKILTQMDWNSLIERNIADEIVFGEKYIYDGEDIEGSYYDEFEEYYHYEKESMFQFDFPSSNIQQIIDDVEHDDLPF